jgi:PAS domain S-box-containing protein
MVSSSSRDLDVESRLWRREVVADLARQALETGDLDRVLEEVVAATSETLACGYCGAFESLPGEEAAVRRAAAGGGSGRETVPTGDGTLFAAVLGSQEPVVVDDLAADGRVAGAATGPLTDGDLAAAVGVRVGPADDPWGLLVAGAADPGAFTAADGEFLRRVADVVASAVEGAGGRTESVDAELEEIYGRISDAVLALDEEWRFTYLNERAHDLINPEGRRLVGETIWDVFPEAVGRKFEAEYERAMYEQETVSFEEYYPEPLDAWFEVRAYPSETGLSVYFRDVTERKRTRQQLAEERDMFAEGPAVVFRWRNEEGWPVEYVSENVADVLGYEPAELESGDVPYTDLLLEAELDRIAGEIEANSDETTERFSHEPYRIRTKDGDVRWVKDTTKIIRDEGGEITHYLGYLVDITGRKEREHELERFETLFEESTDVNTVLDADGTYQYLPPSAENVFGYEPEELEGEVAFEYIHPDDREAIVEEFGRLVEEQDYEPTREFRYRHADGSWIWLEATGRNLMNESHIEGVVVYTRDVTDRKRREQELQRRKRRFEAVFEDPNILVGLLEPDGTVLDINQTAMEYVDADLADVRGEDFWETPWWGEDPDVQADVREWTERAADGEYVDFEADLVRPDGESYTLEGYFRPVTDEAGNVVSIIVSDRDVTERREYERQLEESEQRYRALAEHFPNGIVTMFDEDLRYTLAAGQAFEYLPVAPADLDARTPREVWGDDVGETLEPLFRDALAGETGTVEVSYVDREWLVYAVPVTDEGGEVFAGMTMAQDVTERKEYERRLAESERSYRMLVENFPDGAVAMFDEDMEYTVAGGRLLDAVGVEPSDRVGNSVYDIYPEDIVEEVEPCFEAAFEGETSDFEVEFYDRHLYAHTLPVRNAAGDIFAGMVVVQDVTERREYERELQARARQQQAVAELGQYVLEVDDLDDLMAEAARRVADVLGNDYCKVLDLDDDSRELLLRQGVGWDEGIVGNATVGADEDDSQAGYTLRTEEPVVVEDLETETRFGGPRLLTSHDVASGISTVVGSVDDPWGILGTHDTDVRAFSEEDVNFVQSVANILAEAIERTQYQAELEGLVERLEESNERLEQFAYAASHDLQEPLRMVSSYLQLVEKRYADELDEEAEEFIEFAVEGADRMREMIEALLAYSRVETRGEPFEPVDLEAVLADVREDLQVKIEERDAEVTAEPLPTVTGDRDQLRQVLQNLLDNAIEYSGEGPPRVHVAAERDGGRAGGDRGGTAADRGDAWVISVADEGIGIPPEDAETVFEVFQRLHSREEYAGTGIGLALSERIVERHGGDIWVESEPGEGSTFYFTLPAGGADG